MLQKKAIRVCTDAGYRDHTDPLFATFKTLEITDIRYMQKLCSCFDLNPAFPPPPPHYKSYHSNIILISIPTQPGIPMTMTYLTPKQP